MWNSMGSYEVRNEKRGDGKGGGIKGQEAKRPFKIVALRWGKGSQKVF